MQWTYGGSLGYRTRSSTVLTTYLHSAYDPGTGSIGSNHNLQAAWNWRNPRSNWGFNAAYSRNETNNTGYSNIAGWRVTGTVTRDLPWRIMWMTSFSYLNSRGQYLNIPSEVNVEGIRVTLGWTPQRR